VVVHQAATPSDGDGPVAEIRDSLIWYSAIGLNGEIAGLAIEAANNVYGECPQPTVNVDDSSLTAQAPLEGELEDYVPTGDLFDLHIHHQSEDGTKDIGAMQTMCGWGDWAMPNCCSQHEWAGCEDPECEAIVCESDVLCCEAQWDLGCVEKAQDLCEVCGGEAPEPSGDCEYPMPPFETEAICSYQATPDGSVLYVAPWGPAEAADGCVVYATVAEALAEAEHGDMVLVFPGDYDGSGQCELEVPSGVTLRAIYGPLDTRLNVAASCSDFIYLDPGATMEGFHLQSESSSPTNLTYVHIHSDLDNEGETVFQFNLVANPAPYAEEQWGVEVHEAGARVVHNTFVNHHTGVALVDSTAGFLHDHTIEDNLFYDCHWPLRNLDASETPGTDYSPAGNFTYCGDGFVPSCPSNDPELDVADKYQPTGQSSGVLGKASDGLDYGGLQKSCFWFDESGSGECALDDYQYMEGEVCSPFEPASGSVIHVAPDGEDFDGFPLEVVGSCWIVSTLGEAIESAGPGDLVLVWPGSYALSSPPAETWAIGSGVHVRSVAGPWATEVDVAGAGDEPIAVSAGAVLEGFYFFTTGDGDGLTFVQAEGDDQVAMSARVQFNVMRLDALSPISPDGSRGIALHSADAIARHNTVVNTEKGISFIEPVPAEAGEPENAHDNLLVNNLTPLDYSFAGQENPAEAF
ncbi:MAG: hypothetical protein QF464_11540, partial [Myxococcota bacterium]|nr:hypothetical protein [Myxococcota bacterium]